MMMRDECIYSNNTSKLLDQVSYSDDQHFDLLKSLDGVSLERLDPNRSSADLLNFHSAAETVGFATPGYQNSQHFINTQFNGELTLDPKIFSPDNDGYQDLLNINYSFNSPGLVANVRVFDQAGRLIKTLVNNQLIGAKGSFTWDGINDQNERASIGTYVIFFEVFSPNGDQKQFKKVVVLGARL